MLKSVTNIGKSGLQTWFLQRITAIILGLYAIFLFAFWFSPQHPTLLDWHALLSNKACKLFTSIALLALLIHGWIGAWTVTTDYLKTTWLRLFTQICLYSALVIYLIWGFEIIWL